MQYRLAFWIEPDASTVPLRIQHLDSIEDDPKTEDINESITGRNFTYSLSWEGTGLTYDSELERYVTSGWNIPQGGMDAGHWYAIARYDLDLTVSDYRGQADVAEEGASAVAVYDPYELEAPEYYIPEPAGPVIYLGENVPAHVSARLSGGFDASEWTGRLTWSGGDVIVHRRDTGATVSSPLELGKQEDGTFIGGEDLVVTAGLGAVESTVTFTLTAKDSKGQATGDSEIALLHLIPGTPDFDPSSQKDDFYTIPLSDACGPAYRKINLNGRPMPDSQPQAKEETDEAPEETYIDAFSLNLRHSTTDIYVPVPGSDLALTVRRNVDPEVWNFEGGLRPHERPCRPFGSGWSSNLGAMLEITSSNGPDADGFLSPAEVTVIDDDGNSSRFINYDGYFFPYPSSRHDAKMYLTSLEFSDDTYTFKRKYGKTLEFQVVPGTQVIANNRLRGSESQTTYTYARLMKVTDRLGYNLQYTYGGDATLIPSSIEAYRGETAIPGQKIYIRQNDATRCVTSVWDPSGNETRYTYAGHSFDHPRSMTAPPQRLSILRSVGAPATDLVTLGYEGEGGGKPYVIEPDPIPRINPDDKIETYQVNLNEITRASKIAGSKYTFQYETDDSREIFVKVPGFSGYVRQAGAPRRVSKVTLPVGSAQFNNIGRMRILDSGSLQGEKRCSVRDATGGVTNYRFDKAAITVLTKFKDLFESEDKVRQPKLLFYTEMEIEDPIYGSETYSFDENAGFALSRIKDFSGNITTFTYDDTFEPENPLFSDILTDGFVRFDDPNTVTKAGYTKAMEYSEHYRIMERIEDERDNVTTYEIDDFGRRTNEQKFQGSSTLMQKTEFDYSSTWPGFIIQRTVDAAGDPTEAAAQDLVVDFVPDSGGRMESQTVQLGGGDSLTTTYRYDYNNALVFTEAPSGPAGGSDVLYTRLDYDARHRLKRTTFHDDSYKELAYDGQGRKIGEVDENGHATSFGYDSAGRLVKTTRYVPDADNIVESFHYNSVGSLTDSIDPRGNVTSRTYDGIQRLTSISEPGKGVTQFFYNGKNSGPSLQTPSAFQPTRVIDPRGYETENFYDGRYLPVRKEQVFAPGEKRITRAKYDGVGNKTEDYDGLGAMTKTDYDALNRPTKVTDPLSHYQQNWYTSTGLLWKQRDKRGKLTLTEYDGAGRAIKKILPGTGTPTQEMEYDRAGNLAELKDERDNVTTYGYDDRNRQTTVTMPSVYDAETATTLEPETVKVYDDAGNVIDQWDARNVRTHLVYDAANRVTDAYAAYGTALETHTQTTYDANGNVLTVEDPRGNLTTNTYDAANRLETTLNAESILTSFKYDLAGNRTQVTDGKSQTTKFAYDGLNRLTRTTDAAVASEQLFYNAENKTSRLDSMGRGTTYIHDSRHQLKSVFYQGAPEDTLEYEYDENGNLLSVDQAGTERDVVYEYDDRNRVTDETSNGVVHEYAYDLAGNRTGITYGGTGRELEMVYDDLNRVTSIEDGDKLTEFTYTRTGSEASRTYKATGSTVTSKQVSTFDGLGRLDTRTGYEGSNVIYTYGYDYDANGNVTDIVETYASGLSDRTLEMEYDDADRLELENITEGGVLTATEYEYDAANNRTIRAVTVGSNPTVTGTHAYNTLNQLTGVTFSDTTPAISFSYDAQGNRTSREQDSMLSSYAYDRENRLTTVQLGGEFKTINIHPVMGSTLGAPTVATYRLGGGGTLHTYAYDYRTRRVKRTEAGETTNVVFSGGTAILEMTGTDATPSAPTVEFVRGDGMGGGVGGMLYSERSGTTSVSHNNNRGDIVAKVTGTDANPYAVTYQAAYEAFGTRKAEDGSTADRQKANTKDEDPTGLLNEGFRYRDLETGTFLTRDPAGFVDGPNLYAYVVQNPWSKFDPEGLSHWFQTMLPGHAGDDRGVQRAKESGLYAAYGIIGTPGKVVAHPKVQASLRMGGGVLEMGVGAYATAQSGGGAAAFGSVALTLNGADNFYAGLQSFKSNSYQQAFLEKGITSIAGDGLVGNGLYMASQLGMGFAPALGKSARVTQQATEAMVTVEHGTTMKRALNIAANGPSANYVEPFSDLTSSRGFSTSRPGISLENPIDYALDKAMNWPDEGGAAILRMEMPQSMFDFGADLAGNEIRFNKAGTDALRWDWNKVKTTVAPVENIEKIKTQ